MHELNNTLMGERIRVQRKALNISREQLAEMLGITVKFCGDIESGARGTSLKTLINISDALQFSTDYILFGDTVQTSNQVFLSVINSCPDSKNPYLLAAIEKIIKGYNF